MIKNITKYLAIILILVSCSITPLEQYEDYPILKLEKLPKLSTKDIYVVLNDPKNATSIDKYSKALLKGILVSQNHIKIIDRKLSIDITKEVKIAKFSNKKHNTSEKKESIQVADYLVQVESSNSGFKRIDIAAIDYIDKKGRGIYLPAKVEFSLKSTVTATLYKFPSLIRVTSFTENYTTSSQFKARTYLSKTIEDELSKESVKGCVDYMKEDILNKLSFKNYVIGMKYNINDNQYLVQIDSGSLNNITKSDKLTFYKEQITIHPITNKKILNSVTLGKGKVSSFILENSSWVYVDEKVAKKIKIGHWANKKHKKSFFKIIGNQFH